MRCAFGIAAALFIACAAPRPHPQTPSFTRCRELDATVGTAPGPRLACWSAWRARARVGPQSRHADARIAALTGGPILASEPRPVEPDPGGQAAPPEGSAAEPGPSGACPASCEAEANACDARCVGAGWAACLSGCDRTLAACCFAGPR